MARASVTVKAPVATRRKILEAAFAEFYANGFQGGSLNHVVDVAGTTKGALFHHFDSKQELGYAVMDELIGRCCCTTCGDTSTPRRSSGASRRVPS